MAVVELIAELEGTSPLELTPPLHSVIDPDALNSLFHASGPDGSRTSGHLDFTYLGYDVSVSEDGDVSVSEW